MMQNSRRQFIGGFAALAGLSQCRLFAAAGAAAKPDLRFGVLSDVHLHAPGDEDTFLKALEYFRDHGADGVLIAGDIANTGRFDQLKRCGDCWRKIFPDDKAPDGRHVEKLFVYGNHDVGGWQWYQAKTDAEKAERDAQGIGYEQNRAKMWEAAFGEKYEPIWMKQVKGFTFIGAHWDKDDHTEIEAFMKAHGKEIDPKKPFFYTQHQHPKDTVMGAWAWGRDNGAATRAFATFPNAVTFSGHSHYTLTDERSVWQGAFTSINTASLRYASVDYSLRENINVNGHGFRGEGRKHTLKQVDTGDGRQGMLVSVYGNTLVIERRDFFHGTSLGDDWVLSVPCRDDNSFAARKAKRVPPQFASDAKVTVTVKDGLATVAFPAAKTVKKCRVYEYEVTATLVEDEVDLVQAQRRLMAPDYYLAETPEGRPGCCPFDLKELPIKGHYVFAVRPLDCFGLKGEPITAAVEIK